MSQQPPSQDPYGQPDPYASQQGYSQPMYPGYPGYPQQMRKPVDYAKMVFIGAWVVLGLYGVNFFYLLTLDEESKLGHEEFGDRFFGAMPTLGQGLGITCALLALSFWISNQQRQQQQPQQPPS